ncbi:type I secretion outer membrane protein TolC family (plasmid) [Cupriavidus necator N-1]|uniref:Type I secretion outer membrane protein TolC family n=1 Tax=Cupriavidus necator (strain ATCC 43291 / DSM 13513 / CCUG 52238 / LMG 8453 / N-1) TaxID=1042878 RepID=F8GW51_CUPNN|nr:type I secretion outer membrane protein TolC family [Cupriavidus necator N-1]
MPTYTSRRRRGSCWVGAACLAASLAGCLPASQYLTPAVEIPTQWNQYGDGGDAQTRTRELGAGAPSETGPYDWWRAFGDANLDQLVEDVLVVNSQLAAAAIRIHQARLQAGIAASNAYPRISSGLGLNAGRETGSLRVQGDYSVSLSYELDLWGKLAAERDAARWAARAAEAEREAIRMTLIGDTAKHYWQIGYLNHELVRNEADIANAQRTLAIVRGRHEAGAAHGLDVVRAEQGVATLEALRLNLLAQRTRHRNDLAILLDRPPQGWLHEPGHLPEGHLPGVPDSLPADLLSRRPDLRKAEFELRRLLARINQARAELYPTFSLAGKAGRSSASLVGLLSNPIDGIGLGVVLPLLDWGMRQRGVEVSRDEYEANVAEFRKTWYTALAEVDSALSGRWQLEQQKSLHALSLERAQRAEGLARARFVAGLSDVQPWLDEQKQVRQLQGACAKNRLDRLNNMVTLYKALGGGA